MVRGLTLLSIATVWVSAAAASPLYDAASVNDTEAVLAALTDPELRADVNTAGADGTTALHWAVYHGNAELVDRLIAAGARNRRDRFAGARVVLDGL